MSRTDAEIAALAYGIIMDGELSVVERVLATLYLYHEGAKDLSRTEACTILGVTPSTYHRAITRLEELGIVQRGGRSVSGLTLTVRMALTAPVVAKIEAAYLDLRSRQAALPEPEKPIIEPPQIEAGPCTVAGRSYQKLRTPSRQDTGSPCTVAGRSYQKLRTPSRQDTGSPCTVAGRSYQKLRRPSRQDTGLDTAPNSQPLSNIAQKLRPSSRQDTGSGGVDITTRAHAHAPPSPPSILAKGLSKGKRKEEGGVSQNSPDLFAHDEMGPEGPRLNGTKIVWADHNGTEHQLSFRILETRINSGGKARDPQLLREWAQGEIDIAIARKLDGDLIGWLTHRLNKTTSYDDWLDRRPKPKGPAVKLFGDDEDLINARDNWDTLVRKGG